MSQESNLTGGLRGLGRKNTEPKNANNTESKEQDSQKSQNHNCALNPAAHQESSPATNPESNHATNPKNHPDSLSPTHRPILESNRTPSPDSNCTPNPAAHPKSTPTPPKTTKPTTRTKLTIAPSKCLPRSSSYRISRGFGYWCWKPQVIMESLKKIEDGDILIYADIGCHFVRAGRESLLEKLEILQSEDIACFKMPWHKNGQWTKGDVFEFFANMQGATGSEQNAKRAENTQDSKNTQEKIKEMMDAPQIKGGVSFMRKSERTLRIIGQWLEIFYEHFELVDDSPSHSPNDPDFRENRHDQSIFSLLMRHHKCFAFDDYHTSDFSNFSFGITDNRDKIAFDECILIHNVFFKTSKKHKKIFLIILKILKKIYPSKIVKRDFKITYF